jgi:hypothetical protein
MTTKRLLDCSASDLVQMDKAALLYAIRASEGRVLISETIAITQPLLNNVTNAELAASQGRIFCLSICLIANIHRFRACLRIPNRKRCYIV